MMPSLDAQDHADGIQVISLIVKRHTFTWKGSLNRTRRFPKGKSKLFGLLFGFQQLLIHVRKQAMKVPYDMYPPILVVKTDQTYLSDGIQRHRHGWRRREFQNKKGNKIKYAMFWKRVDEEIETLDELGIRVKVVHVYVI